MKIFVETERLILRELLPSDDEGMFELDSDKDVHKYIGQPVETIEQSRGIIDSVRKQYTDYGIGRWAMIEKRTNHFIGWTGFRLITIPRNNHVNYYDLGYRLIKRYWGKGFATESAIASLAYGFEKLQFAEIYATADMNNIASRNVLTKAGLTYVETFDDEGYAVGWYKLSMEDWLLKQKK
jgi:RimJ/RimL family protein N-acetyltransferase